MRNKDKYNLLLLLLMSVHNFIWFYCYTDFFCRALGRSFHCSRTKTNRMKTFNHWFCRAKPNLWIRNMQRKSSTEMPFNYQLFFSSKPTTVKIFLSKDQKLKEKEKKYMQESKFRHFQCQPKYRRTTSFQRISEMS